MNDGLLHTSPTAVYIAVNAILARVIKSAYDDGLPFPYLNGLITACQAPGW